MLRDYDWNSWLNDHWADLCAGERVHVPWWLSPEPAFGFRRTDLAEYHGQEEDWVLAFSDGSRLHIHTFPDGQMTAHRDQDDPERSVVHAARHAMFESTIGKAVLVGAAVGLAGFALVSVLKA